MKQIIVISIALVLSACCTSQVIIKKPDYPMPPDTLMVKPESLQLLKK